MNWNRIGLGLMLWSILFYMAEEGIELAPTLMGLGFVLFVIEWKKRES